jgi:hypothetical protein
MYCVKVIALLSPIINLISETAYNCSAKETLIYTR